MMRQSKNTARDLLATLKIERPDFHGGEANRAGTRNWSIDPSVLTWMIEHLDPGGRTLETGCGYSTVILGALADSHTTVSLFDDEFVEIRKWCDAQAVSMNHVNFIAEATQTALPRFVPDRLDLVLIDGDHAFPAPFLDWYYTADSINKGGFLMVDDTQIPTGKLLTEFLDTETERWSRVEVLGKTTVYQRITDAKVARGVWHSEQRYCDF